MPATINVKMLTVVHKTSNGTTICFPDVCKTPSPGGPIPIPYPNISMSTNTSNGSKKVKMDKQSIMVKGSKFQMSSGDEPGSAGGVVSGVIKNYAEFVMYSFDVKVEGKNVCRLLDIMISNKKNTPPFPCLQPPLITIPPIPEPNPTEESQWSVTKMKKGSE